jgi:8-oxo-dGTP pyrophosphatase MutT (NUDIX family)
VSEDTYHLGVKALIRDVDGNILLLKVNPAELKGAKNSDYWDLPGGRVQQGSNVEETLKREVEEETNLSDIVVERPVGMVLSNIRIPIDDGTVGLILSTYECKMPKNATLKLSKEHISYEWFSPKETAEKLRVKYPVDFCELIAQL